MSNWSEPLETELPDGMTIEAITERCKIIGLGKSMIHAWEQDMERFPVADRRKASALLEIMRSTDELALSVFSMRTIATFLDLIAKGEHDDIGVRIFHERPPN